MEDYLNSLLSPVKPRGEFVRELQQGLHRKETTVQENGELDFFQKLFWIGAGFASAVLLLTVGIKVIINLVKGTGQMRRRNQKDTAFLP